MENKITQHPITSFSKSIDPHSDMKFHISIDNRWIYQYFLVHASKQIPHKIIGTQKLYFYYLVEFEEICTNIKEINYYSRSQIKGEVECLQHTYCFHIRKNSPISMKNQSPKMNLFLKCVRNLLAGPIFKYTSLLKKLLYSFQEVIQITWNPDSSWTEGNIPDQWYSTTTTTLATPVNHHHTTINTLPIKKTYGVWSPVIMSKPE